MASLKPFAFVLMPFEDSFEDIYKSGILVTAKEKGVVAERVDEQSFSETILERIYRQIDISDFIIADMTGQNPNVFYEVGYAHAKNKLCTLLTQSADDIPFDLRHHRHLVYDGSIEKLKGLLSPEMDWLRSESTRLKESPVTIHLNKLSGLLVKEDYFHHAKVTMEIDINNTTNRRTSEFDAMYFHTGPGWEFMQNDEECLSTKSDVSPYGLKHFIKPPLSRLSPSAWAQVKLIGRKQVWRKWDGHESKDEYDLSGITMLEIVTSEGSLRAELNLDITVDEIPF